jgi:hypothetical protein
MNLQQLAAKYRTMYLNHWLCNTPVFPVLKSITLNLESLVDRTLSLTPEMLADHYLGMSEHMAWTADALNEDSDGVHAREARIYRRAAAQILRASEVEA